MSIQSVFFPKVFPLPPAEHISEHDMDAGVFDDGFRVCNVCRGVFAEEEMNTRSDGKPGKSCAPCARKDRDREARRNASKQTL